MSADLSKVTALDALGDEGLPALFDNPDARQLVHIAYGQLLRDREFGSRFLAALERHMEQYWQALESHLGRHLDSLGVG